MSVTRMNQQKQIQSKQQINICTLPTPVIQPIPLYCLFLTAINNNSNKHERESETERGEEEKKEKKKSSKFMWIFLKEIVSLFFNAGDKKQHVAGFGGGSRAPACDTLVVSDKDRHRSLSPCHAHPAGAYTHLQGRASLHLVIVCYINYVVIVICCFYCCISPHNEDIPCRGTSMGE